MSGPAVSVAGGAYDWHTDAACQETDPELFYRSHGQVSQARRICLPCPVRLLCLESAMADERGMGRSRRHGVWGGLSVDERVLLAKTREKAALRAARDQVIAALTVQGLTPAVIAERVGWSERTVLRVQRRAREQAAA